MALCQTLAKIGTGSHRDPALLQQLPTESFTVVREAGAVGKQVEGPLGG